VTVPNFKDKAGHEVQRGDIVVYAKALGRSAGLQYGVALFTDGGGPDFTDGMRLSVVGLNDQWSHRGIDVQKPGLLYYSDRVLKVPRELVAKEILDIIDGLDLSSYPTGPKTHG
jgi:hypothetical protein